MWHKPQDQVNPPFWIWAACMCFINEYLFSELSDHVRTNRVRSLAGLQTLFMSINRSFYSDQQTGYSCVLNLINIIVNLEECPNIILIKGKWSHRRLFPFKCWMNKTQRWKGERGQSTPSDILSGHFYCY